MDVEIIAGPDALALRFELVVVVGPLFNSSTVLFLLQAVNNVALTIDAAISLVKIVVFIIL